MENIKFRSLSTIRISSLSGHCITIEPGHPVALPEVMHAEAYAAGCVPVDSPEYVTPSVPQGKDRELAITDAIHQLITVGDEASFKKDGTPKVAAVEVLVEFAVTAAEVFEEFEKINAIADKLKPSTKED